MPFEFVRWRVLPPCLGSLSRCPAPRGRSVAIALAGGYAPRSFQSSWSILDFDMVVSLPGRATEMPFLTLRGGLATALAAASRAQPGART